MSHLLIGENTLSMIISMNIYFNRSYIALIFLVIFSIIHGSVYSNKLPDNCACHFTFSGDPDGTCSKV